MQKNVAAPTTTPTAQPKPTAVWAYVGLVTGVIAWLTAAPLPFIDYGHIAGATAGVGLAGPFLLGGAVHAALFPGFRLWHRGGE